MTEEKILHVESSVSSGSYQPIVVQTYGDNIVTMSAESAKTRAIAILQAIAYADSESVLFKTLTGLSSNKGFGKIPPKDLKMAVSLLQLNRDEFEEYRKMMLPILRGMMSENEVEMALMEVDKAYNNVQADESYSILYSMFVFTFSLSAFVYLYFYIG